MENQCHNPLLSRFQPLSGGMLLVVDAEQTGLLRPTITIRVPAMKRNLLLITVVATLFVADVVLADPTPETPVVDADPLVLALERKVEAALESRVEMRFESATLDEVVTAITASCKICVSVDRVVVKAMGASGPKVTYDGSNVPLRSALFIMLAPFDLTYAIKDDTLFVTTPGGAEIYQRTIVYDVTDLVVPSYTALGQKNSDRAPDYDTLSELVVRACSPDTWSEGTGPADDISGITVNGRHLLVVKHVERTHVEIRRFLARLRHPVFGGPVSGSLGSGDHAKSGKGVPK